MGATSAPLGYHPFDTKLLHSFYIPGASAALAPLARLNSRDVI
ncbi:hypothetical protein KVC_2772 [Ketogulonicigenium vulgare]|uniref:Uncharacterized protein n=1 Tax=Ketogulonicigenium vulgare (strain WSH-001) TaxID=759362 RepID=F9Y5T1_KETVW|nr:hypothetical protein KVU_2167 [Ketogulonicigenium vulgare WSH-001]AOZ55774.1 hypothetical protein KVC_2772 [Ketogulonicigenium vulgare]